MFIKKIDMVNYKMGSLDTFIQEIEKLLKDKYQMTTEEFDIYLSQLNPATSASIVDKDGYFIGFIGTKNQDSESEKTDIVLEVLEDKHIVDKKKILDTYKTYLSSSLNINKYNNDNQKEKKKKPIILKSKNLILATESSKQPELYLQASLVDKNNNLGTIGLSNFSKSDQSADLKINLTSTNKEIDSEYLARLIDEYLLYAHKNNIWNINCEVGACQTSIIEALEQSEMNYYGTIPFADISGDYIGNLEMFQHLPKMIRRDYQLTGNEIYVAKSIFSPTTDSMKKIIPLYNNFKMIKPSSLLETQEENQIFKDAVCSLALAMSDRRKFTIPLRKDKFFPVFQNEEYGLINLLKKSSYIVLDNNNELAGFINIINQDNEHLHCEIEVGILPKYQAEGLGKEVTEKFCQELFSLGYASITSKVLDFNQRANYLFNRIANLNGKRVQSYYTDGKLCDMNIYTKLNPLVEKVKIK